MLSSDITTVSELKEAVATYRAYFDTVSKLFVEREKVVELMRYAMAVRQHSIIFGVPGTAKTAVCDAIFRGITGADKFSVEMTMFMTDDALFGPYDTRKMRDEGVLEHRVEHMLPEAHYARLGEFLDASPPTLRSLLGVLHERRLKRGRQDLTLPLLSVYCDTNINPHTFLRQHPNAWAVIDRILFMSEVTYVQEAENVAQMLAAFQDGRSYQCTETLDVSVINALSELIVGETPILQDRLMIHALAEAFVAYRTRRRKSVASRESAWAQVILPEISDRRLCMATEVAEAEALFQGRFHCEPRDLLSIGKVLGTTQVEYDLWKEIIEEKIETLNDARKQQLDEAQMLGLKAISDDLDGAVDAEIDVDEKAQRLREIGEQLDRVVPENDAIHQRRNDIMTRLEEYRDATRRELLEMHGL